MVKAMVFLPGKLGKLQFLPRPYMHPVDPRVANPPTAPAITLEQSDAPVRAAKRGPAAGPSGWRYVLYSVCLSSLFRNKGFLEGTY